MGQIYRSSRNCRDITPGQIWGMTEEECHLLFARISWNLDGQQACPACGLIANHQWRTGLRGAPGQKRPRYVFRCKNCSREFSVTTGTPFQDRKISVQKILIGLLVFSQSAKGISSVALAGQMDVYQSTAWHFIAKVREFLMRTRDLTSVTGKIQVDGGFFGGKRRDANCHAPDAEERAAAVRRIVHAAAPTGRQRRFNQLRPGGAANARRKLNRRCVMVIRQVSPVPGEGAVRTIVGIAKSENERDMVAFIRQHVTPGSTIWSDESAAFTTLSTWYDHHSVIHSQRYVSRNGVNDNQAESFYSRMRREEYGVTHGVRPTYLLDVANASVWREDMRHQSFLAHVSDLLRRCREAGRSRDFRGYFGGVRRPTELFF